MSGLVKTYGDVRAVDGVDFEVAPGTVLGLLGPNGAGKTTAVRVLTTLLSPDAGEVLVDGVDAVRDAAALREQHRPGRPVRGGRREPDRQGEPRHGRPAVRHVARRASTGRELLEQFDSSMRPSARMKKYSGGMRRRLDLAAALVAKPPVLFLDEPTTGLDPRSRLDLWAMIEALVADGTTVLLTTQYLDEADRLADDIAVIDHGKVIAKGTPDELKSRVGGERLEVTLDERGAGAAGGGAGRMSDEPVAGRGRDRHAGRPPARGHDRRGGPPARRRRRGRRRHRRAHARRWTTCSCR